MADDLNSLVDWITPLLTRLEPRERVKMMRDVARTLRAGQQSRIKAQKNTDGSAYDPRKGVKVKRNRRCHRYMHFIYQKPGHPPETRELRNWFLTPTTYFGFDPVAGDLRTFKRDRVVHILEKDMASAVDPRNRRKKTRQDMFQKLRTARYIKTRATPDSAAVGYHGRIASMARVHQDGLTAHVNPDVVYDYPVRELLGATPEDIDAITEVMLEYLTS